MAKLTRVEALRPYLGEYLPLQGMDLRLEQLDELAENIRIMDQEDGALLKYLSVLEVEQPATLQEALRFPSNWMTTSVYRTIRRNMASRCWSGSGRTRS